MGYLKLRHAMRRAMSAGAGAPASGIGRPPPRENGSGEPAALPRGGVSFHRIVGKPERGFSIRR